MRSLRRSVVLGSIAALALVALPAGPAVAKWFAASTSSTTATADTLGAGLQPTTVAAGRTVTVSWAASTLTTTGVAATSYAVTRLDANDAATAVTCSAPTALLSCVEHAVPAGAWRYKVTPAFQAWTGDAGPASSTVTVAAATFTITAAQQLHPGEAVAGASLANFDVGESVQILIDGTGTPIATVTVGATGNVSPLTVSLPVNAVGGTHTLTASGTATTADSVSFTVLVEPPVITATPTGTAGLLGWYTSAVSVLLKATDGSGTGIASFTYDLDSAGATTVAGTQTTFSVSTTGEHTLTADATDNLSQTSNYSGSVKVDLSSPTVTFSPGGYINTTTALTSTASDVGSGVASVRYDACFGSSCTPSVGLATSTTGPSYSATWPTGMTEGTYQVQAVAKDVAGRSTTSTKRTIVLDATAPTASITAPANGATIGGSAVTFTATVDDTPAVWTTSGSNAIFEYKLSGTSTWATLLDPTGSTTTGSKNMTTFADGTYDLRLTATDKAGNTVTSATTTFVVQNWAANTVVTGNLLLGTAGLVQLGDSLTITYTQAMAVSSFCSTWSGDGSNQSQSVTVTLTDGGAGNDTLTLSSGTCLINFGTLDLGNTGYVAAAGATFSATASWTVSSKTLLVSISLAASGSATTAPTGGKAGYTPSASLISTAGVPIKTTVKQTASSGLQF